MHSFNELYHRVGAEILHRPLVQSDIYTALLDLQESVLKIFQMVLNDQQDGISSRVATAIISVFCVMHELKVENPERCVLDKMRELRQELSANL